MATAISFDSHDLQTSSIITNTIDHAGQNNKRSDLFVIAHANASTIPFTEYPNKTITISGTLVGTSVANLDGVIDTFNGYFTNKAANLDIGYNGSTRRYTATATDIKINRPGGLAWAEFLITFTCTNPFGMDTSSTTALNASGRTSAMYSDSYTFLGNAPYQKPIITITYSVMTGGTSGSLVVGNANNGQSLTISRDFTSTDVVVIDTSAKTVTVNGSLVNFSGAFPEFAPGAGQIDYSDSFTTRTFTYNIIYYVMYQ
jgi:phage-related protein